MADVLVHGIVAATIGACALTAQAAEKAQAGTDSRAAVVEVTTGKVTFDVTTNVPALGVHGHSEGLQGRARVRQDAKEVRLLEQLEASVPVKSLGTGIGQRDEHMRKYIFTTTDGQQPDVRLVSEQSSCPLLAGQETTCRLSGRLSIRGTEQPFEMALKVNGGNGMFRASGDAQVKLSSYGIERPSQLGVKTADEVKLHIELTAKSPSTDLASARGGER